MLGTPEKKVFFNARMKIKWQKYSKYLSTKRQQSTLYIKVITVVKKMASFLPANWSQSSKIVIITLAPDVLLYRFRFGSNPTSATTEAVNVTWEPLASGDSKVLRIGSKLKLEDGYKKEALRFWHEDVPKIFKKKDGAKKKSKDEL
jgi:hypothetical protein